MMYERKQKSLSVPTDVIVTDKTTEQDIKEGRYRGEVLIPVDLKSCWDILIQMMKNEVVNVKHEREVENNDG